MVEPHFHAAILSECDRSQQITHPSDQPSRKPMSSNNIQQTDEAELFREMAIALAVGRRNIPDEALVQSFLLVKYLSDPETFVARKRLLERVLRRPIQLQKPVTHEELEKAFIRVDRSGRPATILEFRAPTKH
jgi:hypothetical protein